MTPDPIVEEVRAVREAFAKAHDYDLDAIVLALQAASVEKGRELVALPPKLATDDEHVRKIG